MMKRYPLPVACAIVASEHALIGQIVHRASTIVQELGLALPFDAIISMRSDLTLCHTKGCPLRLADMLDCSPHELLHDLFGIQQHIDRQTGELLDGFLPRFAKPDQQPKPMPMDYGRLWLYNLAREFGFPKWVEECEQEGRTPRIEDKTLLIGCSYGNHLRLQLDLTIEATNGD